MEHFPKENETRPGASRFWLVAFVVATAAIVFACQSSDTRLPPEIIALDPIDLEASPGPAANQQLRSLINDPPARFATLDRSALDYVRLDPSPIVDGCGLLNGVRFMQSRVP